MSDPSPNPSVSPPESPASSDATGDAGQAPSGSFRELAIPEEVHAGLAALGYVGPTAVQRKAFGPAMEGRDLVVQSKTGSGKTTAFALPLAIKLEKDVGKPQAMVLCPTRELALQVATEASALLKPKGLECVAIYGGVGYESQVAALRRGAAMVVGTPGRVTDQIQRGNLKMDAIRFSVLDEADEMLSMGFWEDVTWILDRMPKQRQTWLFSATLPEAIERAARTYLHDPFRLHISGDVYSVEGIDNYYYTVDERLPKPRNLLWVMEVEKPRSALVFCNRRGESEMICHTLRRFGFNVEFLNGDMAQKDRERVMKRCKSGELTIMVATDLASRGIDISDLSHVFLYDLPDDPEVYIHRVGRTGRIGKRGTAVSLVRARYEGTLSTLLKKFGVPLIQKQLPPDEEILKMQTDRLLTQLREDLKDVELSGYRPVAQEMVKAGDASEVLAFLLRHYYSERKQSAPGPAGEDAGEPPRELRRGRDRAERPPRREERAPRERLPRPPRDAEPRRDAPPPPPGPAPSALYIRAGKTQGITEEELRGFLVTLGHVEPDDVRGVRIEDDYSVVDVREGLVDVLVDRTNGKPLRDLALSVEPKRVASRPKGRGEGRSADADGEHRGRPRRRRGGRPGDAESAPGTGSANGSAPAAGAPVAAAQAAPVAPPAGEPKP